MPKLTKIPKSDDPFKPTKALFIHGGAPFTSFAIADITSSTAIDSLLTVKDPSNLIADAKGDAAAKSPIIQVDKPSPLSHTLQAKDEDGADVATLSGSALTLGRCTLSFSSGSTHSSHPIKMRPASIGSRADAFVVDSVPYLWDVVDGTKRCELTKVVGGKRVEVARFVATHSRDREGILLLDTAQVDDFIASLTCVAVFNRVDSFRF